MRSAASDRWAFVTAFNPGSVLVSAEQNRQAHDDLCRATSGLTCYPGEGVGDDGAWPPEISLAVLGLSANGARDLGRSFGQVAVVIGMVGGAAELVLCQDDERAHRVSG